MIFLDGDNDQQVYYNAKQYAGEVRIIENTYNDNDRTIRIMNNRNDFQDKIDNIINVNNKLIIGCQSSNEALRQDKRLRELFPQKAIRPYTGDAGDNKKTHDFSDVCKSWL